MPKRLQMGAAVIAFVAVVGLTLPVGAGAEHPAGQATFRAIESYLRPPSHNLDYRLAWVEVSDAGPYALVYQDAGQHYYAVLRRQHRHWRVLSTISSEALACGTVPAAVVRDLHLRRYTDGWIPCKSRSRFASCGGLRRMASVGRVLAVRHMSCRRARHVYLRHHGDEHVPLEKGQVTEIGGFRCRVYKDMTPPGPSDAWVKILCRHRRQAFRLEYGV